MSIEASMHHRTPLIACPTNLRGSTVDRLKKLAIALRPLLGAVVSWAALIRAALASWLPVAEQRVPEALAGIAAEHGRLGERSFGRAFSLQDSMVERLEQLASELKPLLGFKAVIADMIRAALAFWLPVAEQLTPQIVAVVDAEHFRRNRTRVNEC